MPKLLYNGTYIVARFTRTLTLAISFQKFLLLIDTVTVLNMPCRDTQTVTT